MISDETMFNCCNSFIMWAMCLDWWTGNTKEIGQGESLCVWLSWRSHKPHGLLQFETIEEWLITSKEKKSLEMKGIDGKSSFKRALTLNQRWCWIGEGSKKKAIMMILQHGKNVVLVEGLKSIWMKKLTPVKFFCDRSEKMMHSPRPDLGWQARFFDWSINNWTGCVVEISKPSVSPFVGKNALHWGCKRKERRQVLI